MTEQPDENEPKPTIDWDPEPVPPKETEPLTIHEALVAVMVDVGAVAKRDENAKFNFMFRGIDAVVNAVSPALKKHGVVVLPNVLDVRYDEVTTVNGKSSTACRVRVAYVFHGPAGDQLTATVIGEAMDVGDKASPKAMSVAFRTALLQALALPTDDMDPDDFNYEKAEAPKPMTEAQKEVIGGLMHSIGKSTATDQIEFIRNVVHRQTDGRDITMTEAMRVEDALHQIINNQEKP